MAEPRLPRSEKTLNDVEIYPDPDTIQERIVDGGEWPGYRRRWIFSRKKRPVSIDGAIINNRTIKSDWISYFVEFFEGMASMSSSVWAALIAAIQAFFTKGNSIDANIIVTDTSVNTTSAASLTLTVPAGHAYKVIFAAVSNDTRVSAPEATYTPSGGTAAVWEIGNIAATMSGALIGNGGAAGTGVGGSGGGPTHLWMQAGDTLQISDVNFVAADVMKKTFIFEDYSL